MACAAAASMSTAGHPHLVERGIVPLGDGQHVAHRVLGGDPHESVPLLDVRSGEPGRGHGGAVSEGRHVGAPTVGVEAPTVVRALDESVHQTSVAQAGVSVRAHVEEGLEATVQSHHHVAVPDEFHAERSDTTDRMPGLAKFGTEVGDRGHRSSRSYGTPSAAGAPRRRWAKRLDTRTRTTMVMMKGRASRMSPLMLTPRAFNVLLNDCRAPNR